MTRRARTEKGPRVDRRLSALVIAQLYSDGRPGPIPCSMTALACKCKLPPATVRSLIIEWEKCEKRSNQTGMVELPTIRVMAREQTLVDFELNKEWRNHKDPIFQRIPIKPLPKGSILFQQLLDREKLAEKYNKLIKNENPAIRDAGDTICNSVGRVRLLDPAKLPRHLRNKKVVKEQCTMPIPRTKTHTEDQVLAILTYCERAGNNSPNTVWGLAKRTGVPYQTVYCYLRELEEEGPRIVKIRGKVKLQSGIAQLEKYAEKHHLRIKYNKNWQDNKQPVLRVFLRADEGPRN